MFAAIYNIIFQRNVDLADRWIQQEVFDKQEHYTTYTRIESLISSSTLI